MSAKKNFVLNVDPDQPKAWLRASMKCKAPNLSKWVRAVLDAVAVGELVPKFQESEQGTGGRGRVWERKDTYQFRAGEEQVAWWKRAAIAAGFGAKLPNVGEWARQSLDYSAKTGWIPKSYE